MWFLRDTKKKWTKKKICGKLCKTRKILIVFCRLFIYRVNILIVIAFLLFCLIADNFRGDFSTLMVLHFNYTNFSSQIAINFPLNRFSASFRHGNEYESLLLSELNCEELRRWTEKINNSNKRVNKFQTFIHTGTWCAIQIALFELAPIHDPMCNDF